MLKSSGKILIESFTTTISPSLVCSSLSVKCGKQTYPRRRPNEIRAAANDICSVQAAVVTLRSEQIANINDKKPRS